MHKHADVVKMPSCAIQYGLMWGQSETVPGFASEIQEDNELLERENEVDMACLAWLMPSTKVEVVTD